MAAQHRVTAAVAVGDRPVGLAVAYGAVWVANHGESTVSRIDLAVNRGVATIQVGSGPGRLMAFDGAVWVTDDRDQLVWRIDPSTNRARSIDVGGRVSGAPAAGRGSIWVTVWDAARLVRIEPATGRVVARMRTLVQPLGVQFADGSLWIANSIKRWLGWIRSPSGSWPRSTSVASHGSSLRTRATTACGWSMGSPGASIASTQSPTG
jgi:YVTN family beta-propeller protein